MKNKITICKTYCYQADIQDIINMLVLFILNEISGGSKYYSYNISTPPLFALVCQLIIMVQIGIFNIFWDVSGCLSAQELMAYRIEKFEK